MYIKQDMDFNDLINNCWSGAVDTLKTIEEHDKEDELMTHLEEIFESYFDNVPTMTEVNDYLWFEPETIFECLGISEMEDEEEEIDIDFSFYKDFDSFCENFRCEDCPLYKKHNTDCGEIFEEMKKRLTKNPQEPMGL